MFIDIDSFLAPDECRSFHEKFTTRCHRLINAGKRRSLLRLQELFQRNQTLEARSPKASKSMSSEKSCLFLYKVLQLSRYYKLCCTEFFQLSRVVEFENCCDDFGILDLWIYGSSPWIEDLYTSDPRMNQIGCDHISTCKCKN